MTGGSVVAALSIVIGDRVLVGANSVITDTDFHALDPEDRGSVHEKAASAPVVIGNDVFIGMNSLILKGVSIGRGSVIGAGSVVTGDVPERAIAAGNPARVIGRIPAGSQP
jgi:acetyltransferase-like isoleucine patch superfamily enzyme